MKRIVLAFVSLLITLVVVIIGAMMPNLSSTIFDNSLERENVLRQGEATLLMFAKDEPPSRLDAIAYFSSLDDYNRTIAEEGMSLSINHVKQMVFNFFVYTDFNAMLRYPLSCKSYDSWNPIIRCMDYDMQGNELGDEESKATRKFWYCYWQEPNGRAHVVWVDDLAKSIVALSISLREVESVENAKSNSGLAYTIEKDIVDEFIENFKDYCEADSAYCLEPFFLLTLDNAVRADAWIVNFELLEQSNGVTYNTNVQTVIYFSNGVFYFNTMNPQIIIDEMNRK